MSHLPIEIVNLSVADKFELIDALWEDLATSASGLTQEQSAELDARVSKYEEDPSAVIAWEQVSAVLFKKH